jgi:uncharacterized protein YecT (DUF1311 family)
MLWQPSRRGTPLPEVNGGSMLAHAALLLAIATNPCGQGTTYEMRECWDQQDVAAASELRSTYAKVTAAFRKRGSDAAPLAGAQAAWIAARDATCDFEYKLYLPGTIAPQLGVECDFRMTRARTRRLAALLDVLQTSGAPPAEQPASPAVDAGLNRLYRFYEERLTKEQLAGLRTAELAWIRYRDKACAVEGGSCLTELEKERITELEASWIGEPFW